jgi:hypothetical protein
MNIIEKQIQKSEDLIEQFCIVRGSDGLKLISVENAKKIISNIIQETEILLINSKNELVHY